MNIFRNNAATTRSNDVLVETLTNFLVSKVTSAGSRWLIATALPAVTSFLLWYMRTTVHVSDPEQLHWLQLWMTHHQPHFVRRVRELLLKTETAESSSAVVMESPFGVFGSSTGTTTQTAVTSHGVPSFSYLPAEGVTMWMWMRGWPVSITSSANQHSQHPSNHSYGFNSVGTTKAYKISFWGAPPTVLNDVLLLGRQIWLDQKRETTEVWSLQGGYGSTFDVSSQKSRPLSSVIVGNNIKETLLDDMTQFLESGDWYAEQGIPYRRGYLLHGPPGTGKSSLIIALAGALGIPVILIPMGSPNMDDDKFKSSLGKAPQRSIVLMEDIDCAFQVVNKPENGMFGMRGQGITLSGFLNAIDGVSAQQGRMLFFTTNHKETLLESAMIRPGRIDMEFFMGNATKEGAGELFDRFFSLTTESNEIITESRTAFLDLVEPHAHSYAALQGVLMQSRQDFTQTAANMRQWIAQEKATQQILDQENSARRLRQEKANKTMMDMLASAIREQNQARLESSVPSSHTDTTEGSSDGSDGIVKSTIEESIAVNQ